MADDQQILAQLENIATQLDRIAASLGTVTNFILNPKVQVMPPQQRGVTTGVDASEAFLSGQWVRRGGDVWAATALGAKKRETS